MKDLFELAIADKLLLHFDAYKEGMSVYGRLTRSGLYSDHLCRTNIAPQFGGTCVGSSMSRGNLLFGPTVR